MSSKRMRFEAFKRDGFQCGYCGRTPPVVILEADHVIPISKGGEDKLENIITSCLDCNRGKSNILLTNIPSPLIENFSAIKEREKQLRAYEKFLKKIRDREDRQINEIDRIYSEKFDEWCLSESFKAGTVRKFLRRLPYETVREAMELACSRMSDSEIAIKYFCGVCWKRIKGEQNG